MPASVEGSPNHPGGRVAGMVFVGAPIGSDEYVKDAVRAELESLAANLPTLSQLRDHGRLTTASQARALLLRYCANPQTNFLLRTDHRRARASRGPLCATRRPRTTPP